MEKSRRNNLNEHTTIFNGLLYRRDSSEAHEFRRVNDMLKEKNPDMSWKTKSEEDKILLKKMKLDWAAEVEMLSPEDRPSHY